MAIRVATVVDLPQVLQLRMRLFAEYHGQLTPSELDAAEHANRSFFSEHLDSTLSRTWVAEIDDQVVAVGTLAFFLRPPHPANLAGKEAYLLNMYTLPEFRRRGLASEILAMAKSHAQNEGIKRIWLHASEAGQPLYVAAGFQASNEYMELKME